MESVLDQELWPNFRPKHPCTCPKVARMSENQFVQNTKLKLAKQPYRYNTPVTEKTMWTKIQDPNPSRPSKPSRQISHHSDWNNSEDGKDDQTRAKPIVVEDPQPNTSQDLQPSTSFASDPTPLRQPNMCPKVLSLGRGSSIAPVANWTSVIKGQGCGIFINQSPLRNQKL